MARTDNALIVAAVDGTEPSLRALDWAAREARLLGRKLRVVHAFDWPLHYRVPRGLPGFDIDEFARRVVHEAVDRVREREPEVEAEALHIVGTVGPTLLQQSENAHLIVAGSRGLSGLRAVVLGSVGVQLAALAECPAVIVPDRDPGAETGRVVVGVDGSPSALAATDRAFVEAEARRATLRAVAVAGSASHGVFAALETPEGPGSPEREAAVAEARRRLSESLAGQRERHPGVYVEEEVLPGHPAEVLIDESEYADLVVVGSRGRGGFTGMLLGSVSQTLLSHSHCPVMVVHAAKS
ncbi:universal stress protein [Thermobifida halotolerans]|uniref:Universal stress protein n=1 Tax=Thermobifida halotolerans TaxID=483545 RepID=A0AA97M376_9ACTN|nr:universal stress protein [Thermobifida halotolerans]UOE18899.1 universal stress protein [Thermobifida halotolerans]